MAFVDEARIFVEGGHGGKGCESFYRDKYMRYRRPDGGDGGDGGDVIVRADRNLHTLLDYRFQQHYKGEKGGNGSSKGKKGRRGQQSILRVPVGTLIKDDTTGLLIRDLMQDGEEVLIAKGGAGGRGNINNRIPAPALPGEELTVRFELKLIADVGLIGFPNAGKSTLICAVSKVKSKIADYPFTTKVPRLGIVQGEEFDFIIADLPGLIEGAHLGRGLGDRFLKHAERTKILVHILDMAGTEDRDPLEDYAIILHELEAYSEVLSEKHRIVVANKMDMPDAKKNLKRFKKKYPIEIHPVSAINGDGLDQVIEIIKEKLCSANSRVG